MKSFTFRFWRGTFLAVMMTTWVVPAVTAQRALAEPAEKRKAEADATEQTASPQEKLIGKWGVTSDEDNRFVFTFAADGTFEILATDPETPHRVKAEVSGTYKVDFSVSPAHLDLDATIRKRKSEKPAKHTFEMIVQIIDSNKIRISDMGLAKRPDTFGKQSQVMQRQTTPAPDAHDDAQPPIKKITPVLTVPTSGSKTTFRFIVRNEGGKPATVDGPFANQTRLLVQFPDGKKKEVFNWKEGARPETLQPGKLVQWDVDITNHVEMKDSGWYRISFSVNGTESNQIIVVKD
jgi:hypothetical protein